MATMLCVPNASPTSEYSAQLSGGVQHNIRRARSTPNFTDGSILVSAGGPFAWYSYTSDAHLRHVPQLPVELIDRIIDFLHDDRVTLRACSLVSSTWRDASLHHMFWMVNLLSVARFRKFVHVACFRPRIGQYVREIRVAFPKVQHGFEALIPSIPATLMPNLRTLGLQHTGHTPVLAALLEHPMFTSVTNLCLTHVWFGSFSELRGLITNFRHLRDLSIGNVTWDRDDPPSPIGPTEQQPSFHLRSLALHSNGNFLPHIIRWILSTRVLDELQSLVLYLESSYVTEPFNQVLAVAGQTLEHLDLQMGAIFYSTPQAVGTSIWCRVRPLCLLAHLFAEIMRGLTLAPCVRLSSLHLAPSASGRPPNTAWMVDALRTLPSSCTRRTLRNISLTFSLWDAANWGLVIELALLELELGTPEAARSCGCASTAGPSTTTSTLGTRSSNFRLLADTWNVMEKYATVRRGQDRPSASRTLAGTASGKSRSRSRVPANLRYGALRKLAFHVRADSRFDVRGFVLSHFPALRRRTEVVVQQVW